jgi:hypothetical protein
MFQVQESVQLKQSKTRSEPPGTQRAAAMSRDDFHSHLLFLLLSTYCRYVYILYLLQAQEPPAHLPFCQVGRWAPVLQLF